MKNANKLVFVFLFLAGFFVLSACRNIPPLPRDWGAYENELGHKNFYVVDTIQITDPVWVYAFNKKRFVMSKQTLMSYDGTKDFFIENENVFMVDTYFPFKLPYDFYIKHKIWETKSCELKENPALAGGNIERVWEYTGQPDYFLIILVNRDYYLWVYGGEGFVTPFMFPFDPFSYYRVAIPYCFKEKKEDKE